MNTEALGVVQELLEDVSEALPEGHMSQTERAREVFLTLNKKGGTITPVEEPTYQRTRLDQLGTYSDDPWGMPTYGVDASTTRPIEYTNGLVLNVANAKLAVSGPDADHEVEQCSTVVAAAYLDHDETTLSDAGTSAGRITARLVRFPVQLDEPQNVTSSLGTVAQRLSESVHVLEHLDAIDGPLVIDGAVYPLSVVYWLLLDLSGQWSPARRWDLPRELLLNYVELIETQYERGLPVVGVAKTASTTEVIDTIDAIVDRHDLTDEYGRPWPTPWTRDENLFAQVLFDGSEDTFDYLPYTSWLESRGAVFEGTIRELLEPVADELSYSDPADYRRVFCYVRLPRTGDLLRIEVPKLMIDDSEMRRDVQLKVLKMIARRQRVPQPVMRADELARITQDNRDAIKNMIGSAEPTFNHNLDGRWKDLKLRTESSST